MTKDEEEFRLRPRKPRRSGQRNDRAWAVLFKTVLHYARGTRIQRRRTAAPSQRRRSSSFAQRCAVRATYSRNIVRGQWRAHGRYLTRDSATGESEFKAAAFNAKEERVDAGRRLHQWQSCGDERLWKLIVSPEFGEKMDLKRLTRELMARMETDLCTPLEWIAVSHLNTEHPHIHIALRGIDGEGKELRLDRDYIKSGIRNHASEPCTNQLGYRTELDADAAQRREVNQHRLTSLDRFIRSFGSQVLPGETQFQIVLERRRFEQFRSSREAYVAQRLMTLKDMGLATAVTANIWRVSNDFENVLRSMQRVHDRQKTLAVYGAALSDDRLPVRTLNFRERKGVEGRVLVHGEEENGRAYLMLEGTDGCVHHIPYTPEIEEARARGLMKTNAFVRLRKEKDDNAARVAIEDFGDSDALLRNHRRFLEIARRTSLTSRPAENNWGGWLGRYQASIQQAMVEIKSERDKSRHPRASAPER